jgi:hypothetical protein
MAEHIRALVGVDAAAFFDGFGYMREVEEVVRCAVGFEA